MAVLIRDCAQPGRDGASSVGRFGRDGDLPPIRDAPSARHVLAQARIAAALELLKVSANHVPGERR